MKKSTKYTIIMYAILFVGIGISIIFYKLLENDETLQIIPFIFVIIVCIIAGIFENKAKKIKIEENRVEREKEKQELIKKLFVRSNESEIIRFMYDAYSGNIETLNKALEDNSLQLDYDKDEEENEDYFYIQSINYKKNQFYFLALSSKGSLELNDDTEIKVEDKNYEQILDLIIADINNFFNGK